MLKYCKIKGAVLRQLLIFIITIYIFTGCSVKEYQKYDDISKASLEKVNFYDIEDFYNDDLDYAFEVFKKACTRSKRYEMFKEVCLKADDENNARDFLSQILKLIN